jgi:uncharacterized SAM-binding protein YcdF (DUF218 family)
MNDREVTELLFLRDEPRPANLALVFGHHEPEWAARRARHAAGLYHAGLVPRLLLSGGEPEVGGRSEAEVMADAARAAGVPESALLLESASQATWQNVSLSVELLREQGLLEGLSRVLLVSCPWHMRRVSWIARRGFPPSVELLCCPHAEDCTAEAWPESRDCRERVERELWLVRELLDAGMYSL